ncbi:MAG: competence protein ComEA [Deltaproteobacteria bacterium HGW-Deltaproteobacteria-22]|nr:MAG: competence protein ComEA [Deltaproteobacteria bacterium HGW-Deltaproteobacteria-22]
MGPDRKPNVQSPRRRNHMHRKSWSLFSAAVLTLVLAMGSLAHARDAHAAKKNVNRVEISGVVNINTAPEAKLRLLPGIGQKKAQAIIAYRTQKPFMQPEELMKVKGINLKLFQKIKDFIATAGDTSIIRRKVPAESAN